MWLFLVAIFLMMISHGLTAFVVGFYYLELGVNQLVMVTMLSVVLVVIPNIFVTRGYGVARCWLMAIFGIYLLVGISTFLPSIGKNIAAVLGLMLTAMSALGITIISTKQYKAIIRFYSERWHEFRMRQTAHRQQL